MPDLTLAEATAGYLQTIKDAGRGPVLAELNRFSRWYGPERAIAQMRGHDVSLYAEALGPATAESSKRADHVRNFLAYLKKQGWTETNLAPHLRLRKSAKGSAAARREEDASVELTAQGVEALRYELDYLKEQRLVVREEIRKAMLDKDFRENSPLDAAKEKQGHQEARIRELEAMLRRAVIIDKTEQTGRVKVGSTVRVTNLSTGGEMKYSIVGPTEANAADGKISSVSPVGKALLERSPGDEVAIDVPAGTMRLRVEAVEASA